MVSENQQPVKEKHVIILGAGASITSGYPDANRLRVLMSSDKTVRDILVEGRVGEMLERKIIAWMFGAEMERTIALFRHGGFATVDEFSKLAGVRLRAATEGLKRTLRVALALHDPEDQFEKSDYYRFIQKLFQDGLFPLRNNVSILTFNYDPYLPYLLRKAFAIRCRVSGGEATDVGVDLLTSGFSGRAIGQLEDHDDLCLLQLHGCIAWPRRAGDENVVCYEDLFGKSMQERTETLCCPPSHASQPPVVFPWEIMDEDGNFRSEREFCLTEQCEGTRSRQGGYEGEVTLYQLFKSIWKRARKEITSATKISLIGLSMHKFLNPAFKYLFKEKKDLAELLVVNKEHERPHDGYKDVRGDPRKPCAKTVALLSRIWSNPLQAKMGTVHLQVRALNTFAQFIEEEMG
jgi:hypothetical protein